MAQRVHEFVFGSDSGAGTGTLLSPSAHSGCMELVLVKTGRARVVSAMQTFTVPENSFFFLPPDTSYYVVADENVPSEARSLWFSADLVDDMLEPIDRDFLYMFHMQMRSRPAVYDEEHPLYDALRTAFSACDDEYRSREFCYRLRVRGYLCHMMAALLTSYSDLRGENDRAIYENVQRLRPVLTYIEKHYSEKTSQSALAALCHLSPDYFTHLFGKTVGKTPLDYINAVRVNAAMILLLTTQFSIAEIAHRTGFAQGKYFAHVFRTLLGQTPTAFRHLKKE